MLQGAPKPKPEGPPVRQTLLPEPSRDYRLLEPGFAGELGPDEVEYIRDQLVRDKRLARLWGFKPSSKRRPEQAIRALALQRDPSSGRINAELVRRPNNALASHRGADFRARN